MTQKARCRVKGDAKCDAKGKAKAVSEGSAQERRLRQLLLTFLWLLTFIWLALSSFLSSQTGEETGRLSLRLSGLIAEFFGLREALVPTLNFFLRKAAHFLCSFILGLLAAAASRLSFEKQKLSFLYPLPFCLLFSFLDEIRKAWIPGRHCSLTEAGINIFGCLLSFALTALFIFLQKRRREKRLQAPERPQ